MNIIKIIKFFHEEGVSSITILKRRSLDYRKTKPSHLANMKRKFGLSPFRNWNRIRERNGGL